MSENMYVTNEITKQKIKQATNRPLVPKISNKDSHTKYTYIYDYCNLFEALEYLAYGPTHGTQPIHYPDGLCFYTHCPTCNLRQAIEFLALNRIPTDEDGEKFNHYDDRKYLSEAACEQLKRINYAMPQLEVLIKKRLVKCILTDKNNEPFIAPAPVTIKLTPELGDGFTLTCNGQDYTNAVFDFDELEKEFNVYKEPQRDVSKLTIDDNGVYLQVNNDEKQEVHSFNKKPKIGEKTEHKLKTIFTTLINNPGKSFTQEEIGDDINFNSVSCRFFKKHASVCEEFFEHDKKNGTITFKGDVNKVVRIEKLKSIRKACA